MRKTRYYDSSGGEITERHALDRHGALKDGCTMRVPTTMRDSASKPLITDGQGNGGLSLRKPGFRIASNDSRRRVVSDAYYKADTQARNAWKIHDGDVICDACDGEGRDEDGNQCTTCGGDGVVPSDQNNDSSPKSNDSRTMYSDYDESVSNRWKGSGR